MIEKITWTNANVENVENVENVAVYPVSGGDQWPIKITKDGKSFGLKYEGGQLIGEGDLPIDEAAQKFFDYLRGFILAMDRSSR